MVSLQPYLTKLLKSLPAAPADQDALSELVTKTLAVAKAHAASENWKSQWEYLLKNEIFKLAATEGKALSQNDVAYYDELRDKLDLVLIFTERDACEQTFPFVVLQDLLETQTITSCSHIFSWIEDRAARLTDGMVPQKGKALILLRTLNDLLRRLSKMGSTTIFCGRILTFLSGVFPLGERSGVNLRGEYGPTWEGVIFAEKTTAVVDDKDVVMKSDSNEPERQGEKMQVDSGEAKPAAPVQTEAEKKEEFYNTFWSLQLYFSKPTAFATKGTFEEFKEAINKTMPVIKEATAKERAMMGSRNLTGTPASLKRKREPENEESNLNEYFFAKFLTSPDLLDLEIADTHFRRQFLFQMLILLQHLLTFTKAAKEGWASVRNRSLQMDFTLEQNDAQWVQEAIVKVAEELRQTTPNGRQFADTVAAILEREKNWVKWKNELCAPFDKEPWSGLGADGEKVGLFEATKAARAQMQTAPEPWKWSLGTEPLTEIWEMGYRDLYDLQQPFQPGDVKDFLKKVKQDDARIEMRRRQLALAAERLAQAQAKAAAARAAASTPVAVEGEGKPANAVKVEPSNASAAILSAPKPIVATGNPLHPSLPPKPGSPAKAASSASSSQEPAKPTSAVPAETASSASASTSTTPALAIAPVPVPTPTPSLPPPADEQIIKLEGDKQRLTWLALRTARDQYLQHFGKIGTGDIELLAQEIEKAERVQRGESEGEGSQKVDSEGDVKMV